HHFEDIVDISACCYRPKHEWETFNRFVTSMAIRSRSAAMFDDLAHNLKPAHELGMTTVWIRTHLDVETSHPPTNERAHIHHEADRLEEFLRNIRHAGLSADR